MGREIQEIVIIKGGPSLNGEVLVKQFVLKTKYGSLKLKKSDILAIEYKNPPYTLQDEVQIDAGTRLAGDLKPDVVAVRLAVNGETLDIPKEDIHSIVLFTGKRLASRATRKAVAAKLK